MPKHTPTPWTLRERDCGVGCCRLWDIEARYPEDSPGDHPRQVATVNGGNAVWLKEGEAEANAHLLEAAPDLLEACKAALVKLESLNAEHNATGVLLEAAIAKAEATP